MVVRSGRIAPGEAVDEDAGRSLDEIQERIETKEAKARAHILEMIGDLHHADERPPDNVLFVCKLNPVTTDEDLGIIFARFGTIVECEIIRDRRTGNSLQYAFIEFETPKECEAAYFKMDNVLIDDRRIHVDFSQSVSKNYQWKRQVGGKNQPANAGKPIDSNRLSSSNELARKQFSKRTHGDTGKSQGRQCAAESSDKRSIEKRTTSPIGRRSSKYNYNDVDPKNTDGRRQKDAKNYNSRDREADWRDRSDKKSSKTHHRSRSSSRSRSRSPPRKHKRDRHAHRNGHKKSEKKRRRERSRS